MELELDREPLIEPEVQAHIFSLVSALGGLSASEDGAYAVGDDALAVLKDTKRWLRLYDDKLGRFDVARLLADANLVRGDLLEILALWPENAQEGSLTSKLALLCVDLLTQLTWPLEIDENGPIMNRLLHLPSLRKAHISYKHAVLHHFSKQMLRTVVRVGLPAMAKPQRERSPQEDNIIKVVLYFFRNIAMIESTEIDVEDEIGDDISRSTTISAFHSQDIFTLILTICSSMAEEYSNHDVEILDILYHLLKGVDVTRLFMDKEQVVSSNTKELRDLISKEKGMLAGYARHAPSRHNRFGTMLWVEHPEGQRSTLFGQAAIGNEQITMAEIDKRKQWNKPRKPKKKDESATSLTNFEVAAPLTAVARSRLRQFIEQFLDSSFNPLFTAVRRAIEREADRVLDYHKKQYLYLISWFLRAQSARKQKQNMISQTQSNVPAAAFDDYALVAAVLDQETFVLINRLMQSAQDEKRWQDLNAGMKCFTQILLTVQDMFESPLEDDQEIAENILNRIFYEQTTHDRIIGLLRSYKDQEFGYLDACTELSHVFLRLLEKYSKQNVDMQIRSKRRARKKKKKQDNAQSANLDASGEVEDKELEGDDVVEAHRTANERKFDFSRFAARFISQASVDTFFSLLKFYRELSDEQLKRAHRFFYRVAFKMEMTTYLLRLDIIALFNKLIKGPDGLSVDSATFKEWEELIRQVFRKLVKRMQERPALAVELLFTKISSTTYYLEHGFDKEVPTKTLRIPAALEVKPGMDKEQQLGVAVSILLNQGKSDVLAWIKEVLSSAVTERKAWEESVSALQSIEAEKNSAEDVMSTPANGDTPLDLAEPQAEGTHESAHAEQQQPFQPAQTQTQPQAPSIFIKADSHERKRAIRQDKHLRLLMTLVGLITFIEDDTDSTWIVPSALTSTELSANVDLIAKFEFSPPVYDEGKSAEDYVRRKPVVVARERPAGNKKANGDDNSNPDSDSEGTSASDLDVTLFPAGGPTTRPSDRPDSDKPRRRRTRHAPDEHMDESVLEERRWARSKKEAEKMGKIKSALMVRESDDETDEEGDRVFFEQEEERRRRYQERILNARVGSDGGGVKEKERAKRKKNLGRGSKKGRRDKAGQNETPPQSSGDDEVGRDVVDDDGEEEDDDDDGTENTRPAKRRKNGSAALLDNDSSDTENSASDLDVTSNTNQSPRPTPPRQRRHLELETNRDEVDDSDDQDEDDDLAISKTANPEIHRNSQAIPTTLRKDTGGDADADMEDLIVSNDGSDGNDDSDKENTNAGVATVSAKAGTEVVSTRPRARGRGRGRGRAGFIIESDSE